MSPLLLAATPSFLLTSGLSNADADAKNLVVCAKKFRRICAILRKAEGSQIPAAAFARVQIELAHFLEVVPDQAAQAAEEICQAFLMERVARQADAKHLNIKHSANIKLAIKALLQLSRVAQISNSHSRLNAQITAAVQVSNKA